MSADGPKASPAGDGRPRLGAYPRVTAALSIGLAAQDRRSGASLQSGTIGGRPRFEPAAAQERRGPGELGPVREADRRRPQRPRRAASLAAEEPEAAPSAGASVAAKRRELPAEGQPPAGGMAGLAGFGVYLGELGSPAKPGPDAVPGGGAPPAGFLGARLRAVPSLVDVSVSIGGDPGRGRGASRWTAPLRALAAKRSSRTTTSGATVPNGAVATRAAAPRTAAADAPAAVAPAAELAPSGPVAPSRQGGLRRATRYVVNGILDIAIRRFRAGPGRG